MAEVKWTPGRIIWRLWSAFWIAAFIYGIFESEEGPGVGIGLLGMGIGIWIGVEAIFNKSAKQKEARQKVLADAAKLATETAEQRRIVEEQEAERERVAAEKRAAEHQRRLQEIEEAKKQYHSDLVHRFGVDTANRIVNRRPEIGDTLEIIQEMFGDPEDVSTRETKTQLYQTWKYDKKANYYRLTFMFEGDEMVEWSDKR
jgi:hypothetical protein